MILVLVIMSATGQVQIPLVRKKKSHVTITITNQSPIYVQFGQFYRHIFSVDPCHPVSRFYFLKLFTYHFLI